MIAYLMQKSKKTSEKTNKQLSKTDMITCHKIQKSVTTKKFNTHFVITERKKNTKAHKKIPKPNIHALKMTNTNGSTKHLRKSELFEHATPKQNWSAVSTLKNSQKLQTNQIFSFKTKN